MKTVESIFKPISEYFISMGQDIDKGWYVFEIGLPKSWVFDSNDMIECNIIEESSEGKLLSISPKIEGVEIDDLITFIGIIVDTNKKIAQREEEFKKRIEEMKNHLQDEAKKFYTELDELKDSSFKSISTSFNEAIGDNESKTNVRGRKKHTMKTNTENSNNVESDNTKVDDESGN